MRRNGASSVRRERSIANKRGGIPMNEFSIKRLAECFLTMETNLGLLDESTYGREARLAWEVSRVPVYSELRRRLASQGVSHVAKTPLWKMSFRRRLEFMGSVLLSLVRLNWIRAPRGRRWLVFQHPRLRLHPDGLHEDIYTDDFVSNLKPDDVNVLVDRCDRAHAQSRRFCVWHNDMTTLLRAVLTFAGWVRFWENQRSICLMLCAVQAQIRDRFGLNLEVHSMVRRRYVDVVRSRIAYGFLLYWLSPAVVLVVVSYGRPALILACKSRNIPVIEMQHGVMTKQHLGYSFARPSARPLAFPDVFLAFGRYWVDSVDLPIERTCQFVIGWPHLTDKLGRLSRVKKSQMVFLSQGPSGTAIARFALAMTDHVPASVRLIYKLHPGEWRAWRRMYPELVAANERGLIDVIEGDSPPLHDILAESRWQIGVNSTALFEGLALHCQTFILNLPGHEYMDDLLARGYATLVSHPQDLDLCYEAPPVDSAYMFDPNWRRNLLEFLDSCPYGRSSTR